MRFLPLLLLLACGSAADPATDDPTTSAPTTSAPTTDDTGQASTLDTASLSTDTDGVEAIDCASASTEVHLLTPDELHEMMNDKDFLLINVHVPYAGEIPGTDVHIPYTDTDALIDTIGAEGTKVVLYCKTGPMSATAAANLKDRGYCNLYDLPKGMNGWESAGYPLDP